MDAATMKAADPAMQAPIGDNNPPLDANPVQDRLAEQYRNLEQRRDQLLEAMARMPAAIDDEDTAGRVQDMVKLIMACGKAAEAARTAEKEPYLEGGRNVDGWFKRITEPLGKAKKAAEERLTVYLRRKAEEERRRREEAERKAREEADRAAREAAEAEAKLREETELDGAIEAAEKANEAKAAALRAKQAADAKAADLSRTRGDLGSVGSLRTVWAGEITDLRTLDLEILRPHIPVGALQQALNAYVKAGGRELRGADIRERQHAQVR